MNEGTRQKRVLVVEDEVYLTKVLKSRLMVNRLEVITAADGIEGLEKMKAERPDLVVLDVMLPKLNGAEFVKQIQQDEGLKRIPIVVISAWPDTRNMFDMRTIYRFIEKPFYTEEFVATIKQALHR